MNKMIPAIGVLFVFILWFSTLVVGHTIFPSWAERGQFGDLFGSVNALFSGLAFVGLIYAILLQREELYLQRNELILQRNEMVATRAELAAQVAVQKSLLRAYIGQLHVAAEQARIEAEKMESESRTPGARSDWIRNIRNAADRIDAIANDLPGQD